MDSSAPWMIPLREIAGLGTGLIGGKARLSTPVVLLGVLGGLKLFGFTGLVLGPMILALLQTVVKFFNQRSE